METEHTGGARELRAALARVVEDGPPPSRDVGEVLRRGRQWKRRRHAAVAGSLAATTLAVVAVGSLTLGPTQRQTASGPSGTSSGLTPAAGASPTEPSLSDCHSPDSAYLARRQAFYTRVHIALSEADGTVGKPVRAEGDECVVADEQIATWPVHRAGQTGSVYVNVSRLDEKEYQSAKSETRCANSSAEQSCESTTVSGGGLLMVTHATSHNTQPPGEEWDIRYVRPDRVIVNVTDTSTDDYSQKGLGTAPLTREQAIALATDPKLTS